MHSPPARVRRGGSSSPAPYFVPMDDMTGARGASVSPEQTGRPATPGTRDRPFSASPGLASHQKTAATLRAEEMLQRRNLDLIMQKAQVEEERAAVLHKAMSQTSLALAAENSSKETGEMAGATLWQLLDVALQGAARARAETRYAHAESMIALDRTFNPRDDGRLKARALLAQNSRAQNRLLAAVQQLEVEASSALTAHNADAAAWGAKARLAATRDRMQLEATVSSMADALQEAEWEHQRHARMLEVENDRVVLEQMEERSWAKKEVKRLTDEIDRLQDEAGSHLDEASQKEQALQDNVTRLGDNVARLGEELQSEKAAHAEDSKRYSEMVAQLQQGNRYERRRGHKHTAHTARQVSLTPLSACRAITVNCARR